MAVERDRNVTPSIRNALLEARLRAERDAVASAIPADVGPELRRTQKDLAAERQALADLKTGSGRWTGSKVGDVAQVIAATERQRQEAVWRSTNRSACRGELRDARRDIKSADSRLDQAHQRYEKLAEPHRNKTQASIAALEARARDLDDRAHARTDWLTAHPETVRRLEHLDTQLDVIGRALQVERDVLDGIDRTPAPTRSAHRTLGQELLADLPAPQPQPIRPVMEGPDLGLSL